MNEEQYLASVKETESENEQSVEQNNCMWYS